MRVRVVFYGGVHIQGDSHSISNAIYFIFLVIRKDLSPPLIQLTLPIIKDPLKEKRR